MSTIRLGMSCNTRFHMTPQSPNQLGICSWSTHAATPAELIERLDQLGLKKVQLNLGPVVEQPAVWGDVQKLLAAKGYTIVSGMFGSVGEDYSTLETIKRTGGVVPDATWPENWKNVQLVAQVAKTMNLKIVSCHAGFLPHDAKDPNFKKLVERIGQIASLFAKYGLTLIFETGQETADDLSAFLDAVVAKGHKNIGINFDPANMILYDKGDPVQSLKRLIPRVVQVHIKDAKRTKVPGAWGQEVAIGEGEVNWDGFFQTLVAHDYKGNLVIEREAGADRIGDVRKAIERMTDVMRRAY